MSHLCSKMQTNAKKTLKRKKTAPSAHRKKCFEALITFLVDELTEDDYDVQGPVLKPLQSLFNKMFIRCGQTAVSVIGNMTRVTLLVKNEEDLNRVVFRIKEEFPSIHGTSFKGPGKIGVNNFLHQVSEMKKIPQTKIIPYRFKKHSSQNDKDSPLLYNLNFFDSVPSIIELVPLRCL